SSRWRTSRSFPYASCRLWCPRSSLLGIPDVPDAAARADDRASRRTNSEMIQSDEHWLAVADAFQAAAVTGAGWDYALRSLAHATGSRCGQLIGLGSANTVPFNWVTDLGPQWVEEFI